MAFKLNPFFSAYTPPQNRFRDISFGAEDAMERNKPSLEEDPMSSMEYQSGPAREAYKKFLAEPDPSLSDYKPTKMNRIAAILSGASDGIKRGAGAGFETARNILTRPYDEAMGERIAMSKKLEASANLEGKEFTERSTDFKNRLEAEKLGIKEDRDEKDFQLRQRNIESQIKARDNDEESKGWTPAVDITGKRIYTRVGPTGQTEYKDTGVKVAQSPGEKMVDTKEMARYTSGLTADRQFNFFRRTNPITSGQADRRGIMNALAASGRQQSGQGFQRDMFNANPNTQFSRQSLARNNAIRDNPGLEKEFDKDGNPKTPRASNLLREHLQLLEKQGGIPGFDQGDNDFEILEVIP